MSKRLFGLIGHPLTHSFSAKYFAEKFINEHLDYTYENFDLSDLTRFKDKFAQIKDLQGLNATIPYKEEVIQYLDQIEPDALEIGAVNTIKVSDGKFHGFNTDFVAFRESLTPLLAKDKHYKAIVLGTGGASKAITFALRELNISTQVVSRKGDFTYTDITEDILEDYYIVVNTTPVGSFPEVDKCPSLPYELLTKHHILYDLTYNPEKSLFLQKGEKQGCRIKNGLEMLERQAELSWDIWNR